MRTKTEQATWVWHKYTVRRHRYRMGLILLAVCLLLGCLFKFSEWQATRHAEQALQRHKLGQGASEDWIKQYVASHASPLGDMTNSSVLKTWLSKNVADMVNSRLNTVVLNKVSPITTNHSTTSSATFIQPTASTNDIAPTTITTNTYPTTVIQQAGATQPITGTNQRLARFASGALADSAVEDTPQSVIVRNKNFIVQGALIGDGSGLTNLNGSTVQPNSITSSAVLDGSLTSSDLAPESILFSSIARNGCNSGQVIKRSGSAWVCGSDDGGTAYVAGPGINETSGAFTLDFTAANTWAGLQTFNGGIGLGGSIITGFGDGVAISNGGITTTLGSSIGSAEIDANAVTSAKILDGTIVSADIANNGITLAKIASAGCINGQMIIWNGTSWGCGSDATGPTYGSGAGITINGNTISLDVAQPNVWSSLQNFGSGIGLGGNVYTNLAGAGLSLSGGTLSASLGDSVDSSEIVDGTISAGDIANAAITVNKLANPGCTGGQLLVWNGSAWVCGSDTAGPTYSGGAGVSINGSTISLATNTANTWSNLQTFANGIGLGGNVYTNLAGGGLSLANGTLSATLGTSVDSSEIVDGSVGTDDLADGAVTIAKLASAGCSSGQLLHWNGTSWVCGADITGPSYSAGAGLSLNNGTLSLNTASSNTWSALQHFGSLELGGTTYTSLGGSGLTASGGTLGTTLGTSIDSSEIVDGTISASDIADGAITIAKLAGSSCSSGQILSWNGTGWSCGIDSVGPTYTIGGGLNLNGSTVSLNLAGANNWTGLQTFGAGISLGGNTYTNIAGTGLQVTSGVLSASLGVSIDSSEILNGTITDDDIANGSLTLGKLAGSTCSLSQSIKWDGQQWICAVDNVGANYTAGAGLSLAGNSFSLNLSQANSWAGLQTFSSGIDIGGTTYTSLAGTGLSVTSGTLGTTLGTSIDSSEIADGTIVAADIANNVITTAKLAGTGCNTGQILSWNGTSWGCVADGLGPTYAAGAGLSLSSGTLSLNLANANNWTGLQTFGAGISVGGNTYTSLAGSGLSLASGTLSATLGTSVDSSEIIDGTISASDIADGAITAAKLAGGSCINGQILAWNGTSWGCASDSVGPTYTAGSGISLAGGAVSLNLSQANSWTGVQTFSNGIGLGGNTYTSLAGSGLTFTSGTLGTSLGTSVDSSEIVDGTIIANDIASGAVTTSGIADGTIATADISANAINTGLIVDGTIVAADIADGAVTSAKILDGTILAADLAAGAVTSSKILDGTIVSADLASGAIATTNLGDGAVTADKLSAAARKHTVTMNLGTIAAAVLTPVEQPVFVAPTNGTITNVSFTTSAGVSATLNQGSLSIQRKTATATTVGSVNLATTSLSAFTAASPSVTGGASFATGDIYSFKYNPGTLGVAINNLLITIDYTTNE